MKINQVEELVGVTKKNIRFYEEQGLVRPGRDPANGYRDYSLADADQLRRVKLLRRLDVPCEEIRRVLDGEHSLQQCMESHRQTLSRRQRDLEHAQEICAMLASETDDLTALDASTYLERIRELEKGGVQFMDVTQSDVGKRRGGALLSAVVWTLLMAGLIVLVLWGNHIDPIPTGILIGVLVIPCVIIVGVWIALAQRMKELKGGEYDEARQY